MEIDQLDSSRPMYDQENTEMQTVESQQPLFVLYMKIASQRCLKKTDNISLHAFIHDLALNSLTPKRVHKDALAGPLLAIWVSKA